MEGWLVMVPDMNNSETGCEEEEKFQVPRRSLIRILLSFFSKIFYCPLRQIIPEYLGDSLVIHLSPINITPINWTHFYPS